MRLLLRPLVILSLLAHIAPTMFSPEWHTYIVSYDANVIFSPAEARISTVHISNMVVSKLDLSIRFNITIRSVDIGGSRQFHCVVP